MRVTARTRARLLLEDFVFALLLVAVAGLLVFAAGEYRWQRDLTHAGRNSLAKASLDTLRELKGPVVITAYATERDPRAGPLRERIREFLEPWRRAKPDLELLFVDPTEDPKRTTEAGVQTNGELVVEFGGRSERLSPALFSEQAVTSLLTRLARQGERLVMVLDGHGERRLDGKANHDLGEFGARLAQKGLRAAPLNLALAQDVPANAAVLVIASPQVDLLPGETAKIEKWLAGGGNLLWLIDQEPLRGLQPLAEQLGLVLGPGVVVDPAARELKAPATWALGVRYGPHPATRGFDLMTVFPFARAVGVQESGDWRPTILVEAAPRGWVETGSLEGDVAFDKAKDQPGPVPVAIALSRMVQDREQRVAVVGSGHFLANSFAGNGGNLDFGLGLVNWLTGDDHLVMVEPRPHPDTRIQLDRVSALLIAAGYLIVLPLAFFGIAAGLWWRRRKL